MTRPVPPASPVRALPASLVFAGAIALSACGGGSSSGDAGGGSTGLTAGTGALTLSVTDKPPMPEILEVNVVFTGVTLKPEEGEAISFACAEPGFDCSSDADGDPGTRTIDLRKLIGDTREVLLDAAVVPAGRYEWIRLRVDAATPARNSTGASNVVLASNPDGQEPLVIPSGQQSGLKLVSGFEVPDGGAASFTVDFDLRRGLVRTGNGKIMLKPAHRLVDNGGVGVLRGEVDPNFAVAAGPPAVLVGDPACEGPAAYAYSAEGFTTPGQVGSDDAPVATTELQPVTTGGTSSNLTYEIGFLEAGDYQVAIACAEQDDDDPANPDILISATQPATIVAGQATRLDFLPPSP